MDVKITPKNIGIRANRNGVYINRIGRKTGNNNNKEKNRDINIRVAVGMGRYIWYVRYDDNKPTNRSHPCVRTLNEKEQRSVDVYMYTLHNIYVYVKYVECIVSM